MDQFACSCLHCPSCQQIHLFDIDIPGKIRFMESDSLTAGSTPLVVDTGEGDWTAGKQVTSTLAMSRLKGISIGTAA